MTADEPRPARASVNRRGSCDRPSHGVVRQLCPLHGCAFCCNEWFVEIAGAVGSDVPPLGPPAVGTLDELGPEWHRPSEDGYNGLELWEAFVGEYDECRICREIAWRAMDPNERAVIEAEDRGLAYCETCFVTQRTARICVNCYRCEEHTEQSSGECEDVAERWSRVRKEFVPIYFGNHDWHGGAK